MSAEITPTPHVEVTPTRRADATANHRRIIEAAQAAFSERGLDVEIGEIAALAGVGVGTLYRHFANRDDLLRATLQQTMLDAQALVTAALKTEDPVEALRGLPRAALEIHERYGSLFAVMHDPRMAKLFSAKREIGDRVIGEFTALFSELLTRGATAGVFRADLDPEVTAVALLGSMGSCFQLLKSRRPLPDLADALTDFMLAVVIQR